MRRLALVLIASLASPATQAENSAAPSGQLHVATIELEAPDAARTAYLKTFRVRQWTLPDATRDQFERMIAPLPLRPRTRAGLTDPDWWTAHVTRGNQLMVLHPPPSLLQDLTTSERRALYGFLAQWTPNKPERWPLVFQDAAAFHQLQTSDVNPVLARRVQALCYPFAGGFAFSDFSVIAAEFPDQDSLQVFLRAASRVQARIPRLNLRTAGTVVNLLGYWTVDHRNTFAQPLLEALLDAETDEGIEVASILPSSTRMLSNELGPEDVTHDFSYTSYVMAVSLAQPGAPILPANEFFDWFDQHFEPVQPPYRMGDVLTIVRTDDAPQAVAFACGYISDQIVFAKDPVGLGLWRFFPLADLVARNPNFDGTRVQGFRARSLASSPPSPARPMPKPAAAQVATSAVSQGSWGTLRSTRIRLTPPDSVLAKMQFVDCGTWTFESLSWNEIDRLLRQWGVPDATIVALQTPALRFTSSDGFTRRLRVPDSVRVAMMPSVRTALYRRLAQFEPNPIHRLPRLLPPVDVIDRAQLNSALRSALDRLTFERGDRRYLVDADLLLRHVSDPTELTRLKSLLFSVPSLSLELLKGNEVEVATSIAYWTHPAAPNAHERLKAFATEPRLMSIDVLNLLPPLARRVINSFPDNLNTPRAANCFWTALNFDRINNDNQLLPNGTDFFHSAKVAASLLHRDYEAVPPPYRLGDVLTFSARDAAGNLSHLEHAMIHIADDIVLTKNGVGEFTPFTLSHLPDVASLYAWAFGDTLQGYRRRPD